MRLLRKQADQLAPDLYRALKAIALEAKPAEEMGGRLTEKHLQPMAEAGFPHAKRKCRARTAALRLQHATAPHRLQCGSSAGCGRKEQRDVEPLEMNGGIQSLK